MEITTIGLDLAKTVFQVHGIDAAGNVMSEEPCGARKCYRSSRNSPHVWSAWRRAAHRIIGAVS